MLSLNCSSCQSRQRLENLANIPEIQNLPAESLSCSSSISLELGAGPFSAHQNLKSRDPQQIRAVQVWTNKCCNHNPDALFIKHSELLIKAKQGFSPWVVQDTFILKKTTISRLWKDLTHCFLPQEESHLLKKHLPTSWLQTHTAKRSWGKKILREMNF